MLALFSINPFTEKISTESVLKNEFPYLFVWFFELFLLLFNFLEGLKKFDKQYVKHTEQ